VTAGDATSAKPRWIARNERERQVMIDWVNARLDSATEMERIKWLREEGPKYQWVEKENGTVVQVPCPDDGTFEALKALEGDIGPARALIRKHYPLLVDLGLVRLPRFKRGQKFGRWIERSWRTDNEHRAEPNDAPTCAAFRKRQLDNATADVRRIRRIWKDHYGLTKRSRDQVSAIQIAADRHGVTDTNKVAERLKHVSRTK
jgi:hypothetical protein